MNIFYKIKTTAHNNIYTLTHYFSGYGLRIKFTLIFYLITLGSVSVVGYFGYQSARNVYYSKAIELVNNQTTEVAHKMNAMTDLAYHDLNFLGAYQATLRYHYWLDIHDEKKAFYWKGLINNLLMEFLIANPHYYQIRFLDTHGFEKLGVTQNMKNSKSTVKIKKQLSNKKTTDYFIHGMTLNKGETYASKLSPNMEHGKVERPLVPVIRFVTPIIGDNNVRYGILVINILAKHYFQLVQTANTLNPNHQFYLINKQGEYFFHNNPKKTFATVLGHNANFNTDFPGLLANIVSHDENPTLKAYGKFFSFQHIKPNGGSENSFILVGIADVSKAMTELHNFIKLFFLLVLVVSLIVLLIARRFINSLMSPLEAVTRQIQALSEGKTNNEIIEYTANDEIGRIVASQHTLMTNMERLATQADIISSGDFSNTVPLLSKHDRLGKAINNMTLMLNDSHQQEQHNNKLKDAINNLNQALTGELNIQELAAISIRLIGRTLGAKHGFFYRYDPDKKNLILLGSYMLSSHGQPRYCIQLGEGIIGQVAQEHKAIILHTTTDTQSMVTDTPLLIPQHIYSYPLLHEGQLLGVIEIAALEAYQDFNLNFLNNATTVIASFFYAIEQSSRIKKLLHVSEQATQQTKEKNIKLQDANAIMEKQQQQLQQQSIEQQQTNAQLEEQQQQMEQQAAELKTKNYDLVIKGQQLSQRAEALELASQYKSEFLANMSHELRTPLNAIILLSKMLAMNEEQHLTEEEVKRASIVHHSGEELLRLINDILDLSKIESGKMELNLSTISTRELGEECYNLFSEIALNKNLDFIIDDQMQSEFISDRDKLSQIVRNLLSNAFKFTKQGRVTLCFKTKEHEDLPLHISVIDTGIGISNNKQPFIFEAFQQLDGSISREYGGTGLGLSISQRFAALLGGNINLQSNPEGSCFSLLLPLFISDTSVINQELSTSNTKKINTTLTIKPVFQLQDDRNNLKDAEHIILVIDDDPVFLEALILINNKLKYKTLIATTGQEGLRMAKTYRPNGILLDLDLPDMDGHEVLHSLKTDRELRNLPVYIVSARDKPDKSLLENIVGYLQKPFNDNQLMDAEAKILHSLSKQSNGILLLEGQSLSHNTLEKILQKHHLNIVTVRTLSAVIEAIHDNLYHLIIIDLVQANTPENPVEMCQLLHKAAPDLPLILYSNKILKGDIEAALHHYTDSIIINAPQAEQRILASIERFLQNTALERANVNTVLNPATPDKKTKAKRLNGKHILVIDDDPRNLFVVTSALEQQGALVDTALNAQKGLEKLRLNSADLVFMDIMMPGMDGYAATQQIRSEPALCHIPIIILTAKALKEDREKALNAGANDYLSKPVDYVALINITDFWCKEKR